MNLQPANGAATGVADAAPIGVRDLDGGLRAIGRLTDEWLALSECGRNALNLVPSENRLSPLASLPLQTDFYNRYFFNDQLDPSFWQFRGGQAASGFEVDVALPALRRLTAAEHVNVRPISGMSAMLIAVAGLGAPGSTVVSIDHACGGHYATAALVERLGMRSSTVCITQGRADLDQLAQQVFRLKPSLVYLDLQNSLDPLDLGPMVQTIRACHPQALVHADISHVLGLVLGGALANPLDLGADSAGGSTHKTFPGPHKGMLFTRSAHVAERLKRAQFDLLSSHHFAETISLGLAAVEFETFGAAYAHQVLRNASAFGRALSERGFDVVGGPSRSTRLHQVWVRIGDAAHTDRLAEDLYRAGVRVNVQTDLPGHDGPMFRLGLSEITFQGADELAMSLLADSFQWAVTGLVDRAAQTCAEIRAALIRPYHYTDQELRRINYADRTEGATIAI